MNCPSLWRLQLQNPCLGIPEFVARTNPRNPWVIKTNPTIDWMIGQVKVERNGMVWLRGPLDTCA